MSRFLRLNSSSYLDRNKKRISIRYRTFVRLIIKFFVLIIKLRSLDLLSREIHRSESIVPPYTCNLLPAKTDATKKNSVGKQRDRLIRRDAIHAD